MKEQQFEAYMAGRALADRTRAQRTYALKRIERAYGLDLDAEFERDRCGSLLATFAYSAADERAGITNPSRLDIDQDKLLTHLRWYRTHLVDYCRFCSGDPDSWDGTAEVEARVEDLLDETVGKTFALERDLQFALRSNLEQLEPGLAVADGGTERKVDAGFIDILARDRHGLLTVIELKADVARPEAVAQILSYMGCVAAEMGEHVRGILVAGEHHPRVVQAVSAVPNLELKRYRFRFEFV